MDKIGKDAENSAERRNLPSRYFWIPGLLFSAIAALVVLFIALTSIPKESCHYQSQIELEMNGLTDGWYNFSVVDTCIFEGQDNLETFSLQNVFLFVGEQGRRVEILDNDTMVSYVYLDKAKENGINPFYLGAVEYLDTDGDECVSKGDFLLIMSTDHGGPLEEGRVMEIDNDSPALLLAYFCCQ